MRSHDEDSTRPSAQAFTPEYLELLDAAGGIALRHAGHLAAVRAQSG